MSAHFPSRASALREAHVPVDGAELYCREIGQGQPIIVIHGGPDFDHTCLLPDMDRLSDAYRLIYYDQRGRGRSRGELRLDEINIERYVEDLDRLRSHMRLDSVAILGHSWGGHVAMHYALHHPDRVSHMILMNTAPASHDGYLQVRQERVRRRAAHQERLAALISRAEYRHGDPAAVAECCRIDYGTMIKRPEHLARLNLTWTREDILRGRAIEDRLMEGLYWSEGFTLVPGLRRLRNPTLVIHGDYDVVPVEHVAQVAGAIPGARLVVLRECGHFSYIESPEGVRSALEEFFAGG